MKRTGRPEHKMVTQSVIVIPTVICGYNLRRGGFLDGGQTV